jgi:hypothetical protein
MEMWLVTQSAPPAIVIFTDWAIAEGIKGFRTQLGYGNDSEIQTPFCQLKWALFTLRMWGSDFYVPKSSMNIEQAVSDSLHKARSIKTLR